MLAKPITFSLGGTVVRWTLAGVAMLCGLLAAPSAHATERAYLDLTAQKQGHIVGLIKTGTFIKQWEIPDLQVSPASGSGPVTLTTTLPYQSLPSLITALTSAEVITKAKVTVMHTDVRGQEVPEFSVELLNARVTSIALDVSAGFDADAKVILAASNPNSLRYTDASGKQLTTAVPSVVPAAHPTKANAGKTISADKLKSSGGVAAQLSVANVNWQLTAPPQGGAPTIGVLTFAKAKDPSSDALKAAAARGDSLAGTKLFWRGPSLTGAAIQAQPADWFYITIGSAKLAALPASTIHTSQQSFDERYTITFSTPPSGSYEFQLTRPDNGSAAQY